MQTKVVHVEVFDEELQERYSGQFTIKRLSVKDNALINTIRTQLNGNMHVGDNGMGVDPDTNAYNQALATLQVAIVTTPKDFSLDEVYSIDYIRALYREVTAFQDTFRRGRKPGEVVSGAGSQSQGGSSPQNTGTQGSGDTPAVVPTEIQYSLNP